MNAPVHTLTRLQRAVGTLTLEVRRAPEAGDKEPGGTVLSQLYQEGCLKARFPRLAVGATKRGVLINTTGGIADGDSLSTHIMVEDGASLALTSQAAERVYRARDMGAPATLETRLEVGAGASLFWLPQETILFNGAAIHRQFEVSLAEGSRFAGGEMLVLGRTAMKEHISHCNLFDRWRVRVGGKLLFADGFRLHGSLGETARGPAQLANTEAYSSFFYVGPDPKGLQATIRQLLEDKGEPNPNSEIPENQIPENQIPENQIIGGCSIRGPLLIFRAAAARPKPLTHLMAAVTAAADTHMNGTRHLSDAVLGRWIF